MPTVGKTQYRIDWNGTHNLVVIDDANSGHVEMTLEEFTSLADRIINGLFGPDDPVRRRFRKARPQDNR